MGKFLGFVLTILAMFGLLFLGVAAFQELGTKQLQGVVYDCSTKKPVPDVTVSLLQKTIFTWDKTHHFSDTSSPDGSFSITFDRGNVAHLLATKEGYLVSEAWMTPSKASKVWLLRSGIDDRPGDINYGCKRQKECYVEEEATLNGRKIMIGKNECETSNLK